MIFLYFIIVPAAFAANHTFLRTISRREARTADRLVMWWSAAFWVLTWVLSFVLIAMVHEPTLTAASRVFITVVCFGVPGIISAVLVGRAWRSWKPAVALLLATTVICTPELFFNFGVWFLATPVIWNAMYVAGCVGSIIEHRKHPSLSREAWCHSCGYRYQRGGSPSFCPDCGVARVWSGESEHDKHLPEAAIKP